MTYAAHAAADPLTGLLKQHGDNVAALASLHHGAAEPTAPIAFELWADSGAGVQKMRKPDGTGWNTLWPLAAAHTPTRFASGFVGVGQFIDLGWKPEAVTIAIETVSDRTNFIFGERALTFVEGILVGGDPTFISKRAVTLNEIVEGSLVRNAGHAVFNCWITCRGFRFTATTDFNGATAEATQDLIGIADFVAWARDDV